MSSWYEIAKMDYELKFYSGVFAENEFITDRVRLISYNWITDVTSSFVPKAPCSRLRTYPVLGYFSMIYELPIFI